MTAPNPQNSLTRYDTFGIRPDLFKQLTELTPTKATIDGLIAQAADALTQAENAVATAQDADLKSDEGKQKAIAANTAAIDANNKADAAQNAAISAQEQAIAMLALQNHGALYIQNRYVLPANTWTGLDFSGVRGTLKGCETAKINGTFTGIRFLAAGDWSVRLRVNLPPGDTIIGTSTGIRITLMPKGSGTRLDRAASYSFNNGFDQTLTVDMTASVPESGCYVYAEGYASTTSGNSSWWPSDTGPELTEFSVRQLSIPELA